MLVEFSGKKTFPLEFNVNDKDVTVLFDSYAVNEAFDVLAGDPQKWMSGDQWETLTSSCAQFLDCLLYTSPSPRDQRGSRMPSSA